jgi:hypothetical protein
MIFEITDEQQTRVEGWLRDVVYPEVIEEQKRSSRLRLDPAATESWRDGCPYSGAMGGMLIYEFIDTSLGQRQVARYGNSHRLDLTDYDCW